eukprot:170674_1
MDAIGTLNANELSIEKKIESYPDYPNVITIHPTIAGYNKDTNNVIAIVDLAQQAFEVQNESLLNTYWWLSFNSYCSQCKLLFSEYIVSSFGDKVEMDTIDDIKEGDSLNLISQVIFSFISGTSYRLSTNDDIAELFIENHFETDSLIALHTPPSPEANKDFSFLTFSADNPYANMDKLQISPKPKSKDNEEEADEKNVLHMIRADIDTHSLHKWYTIGIPDIASPKTTSRESQQCIYTNMLAHWECRLSQNKRFLLIFPEKLGEIADVYLSSQGSLYWIQSLANKNDNKWRRVFAVNECNVTKGFESKVIKLLVSTEEPARFKILPCGSSGDLLIWNFSINGACNDLFTVIGNDKMNNKLCAIDNAQNFNNYRFKSGDLRDLIRDVPKICSLNGEIVFGGACFLSVLNDMNAIHVYDAEDAKALISSTVPGGYSIDSWIPVQICPPKDSAKWITDYVPFKNTSIVARWNGDIGKSVYGIWRREDTNGNWKCCHSAQYDDMKWNNSIMSCYHFGDRIKTILLAIELQS